MKFALALAAAFTSVNAGTVLWDGFWGADSSVADFDKWSFGNQVGKWQWYIHGSQPTTRYLGLDAAFKNPADTSDAKGVRTTIDTTAFWNGQNMARTEILPQTKANLGQGHLFYHFSLKTSTTNAPNPDFEHQIAFFESHFTELKFGKLSGTNSPDNTLRWMIGGVTKWSTPLVANTWYNFAYDIDFSSGMVGLYASTGSDALKQVVAPQRGSPSTNSADFHIGVLRLPNGGTQTTEDYFWSRIFVEQAPITTNVAGPNAGSAPTGPAQPPPATPQPAPTSTVAPPTTTAPSGPQQSQWGQCGGTGYTGPTVCASPFKCVSVSPPYYSQCQ